MNVLMPCCGLSSRFPKGMPKYVRPLNDLRPMFSWSLDSVRKFATKIYVAARKEDQYFLNYLEQFENIEVMFLDYETQGPAHTVFEMIQFFQIDGSFLVKDCDCSWEEGNWDQDKNLVFIAWRETAIGDRGTKSWVDLENNLVLSIEEKQTPKDWYVCGGYQFRDSNIFCKAFENAKLSEEIYCSHIIKHLLKTEEFGVVKCNIPYDWGTWEKYVNFKSSRKVYFVDLDGTLVSGSNPQNFWENSVLIEGAKNKLIELKKANQIIYIVTSRPSWTSKNTEEFLVSNEVPFDKIIYDIPVGPRVFINDYAESSPYPSVVAINTKRNSGDWIEKIR